MEKSLESVLKKEVKRAMDDWKELEEELKGLRKEVRETKMYLKDMVT